MLKLEGGIEREIMESVCGIWNLGSLIGMWIVEKEYGNEIWTMESECEMVNRNVEVEVGKWIRNIDYGIGMWDI